MTGERNHPRDVRIVDELSVPDPSEGSRVSVDEPVASYALEPGEPPLLGVVRAVAAVRGREPTALPPLYDVVDPDALDRLVGGPPGHEADGSVRVAFVYAGTTVSVDGTGRIQVHE